VLTADHHFEDVLSFWFPTDISSDRATLTRQIEWWFRGGADGAIVERFTTLLEQAARGELDGWARMPRSRLALILVLDQFSRTVYRGTARAYAQDAKAIALALEGVANGHYLALETPWEKTFFSLPLGHSESLVHLDVVVRLAEDLVLDMPEDFRWWFDFSASQARANRDVIARFGRHPHRNELLGRTSTAEELEYLAAAQFVHTRPIPR
jgi:uncharacterized protein (DUF924 family)